MWKIDTFFQKYCAYKNETQKQFIHEELKKLLFVSLNVALPCMTSE